ncbi:MAG TPA: guanylate kinase [Eubacterium sp.]|nr:guanylate kinase [Eubacterium sp.]
MSRIWYILGKSASGKDSIYKELIKDEALNLKPVVLYTTRPMREGEKDKVDYNFIDEDMVAKLEAEGKVIEKRVYQTVHGPWTYMTCAQPLVDGDMIAIGTPESYEKIRNYYPEGVVVPIYIEVPDDVRLMRAIKREQTQSKPSYEEVCRRFLADSVDFSEDKLNALNISRRFCNDDFDRCLNDIRSAMKTGEAYGYKDK